VGRLTPFTLHNCELLEVNHDVGAGVGLFKTFKKLPEVDENPEHVLTNSPEASHPVRIFRAENALLVLIGFKIPVPPKRFVFQTPNSVISKVSSIFDQVDPSSNCIISGNSATF
jgi:hypothetical protein